MKLKFSEAEVQAYIYKVGLESIIDDLPNVATKPDNLKEDDEVAFELWKIIKDKALEKIIDLHNKVQYGELIGSSVKLPMGETNPMELDLLGVYENGLFIIELKINKSAERNAFSELFAYSNYIAGVFPLSGNKDITNVLIANMDAKITKQAFLYDLLIAERNIILYQPYFTNENYDGLRLRLYTPTDEEFKSFVNDLLSHKSMSCVVASFPDMPGWIDSSKYNGGNPPEHTLKTLTALSHYTAQLMEKENFHGFCFIRKRWKEVAHIALYENSIIICALNPFKLANIERLNLITKQIKKKSRKLFIELPEGGFEDRLADVAEKGIKDSITEEYEIEFEFPLWFALLHNPLEVVTSHNIGFRPTGIMREAYSHFLSLQYTYNQKSARQAYDISKIKIEEISNWFKAWEFMRMCGF